MLGAKGQWLVPPRYEGWRTMEGHLGASLQPEHAYTVLVRRVGRWGVLDVRGRETVATAYTQLAAEPGG